jgi:hypothetical protein
MRKVRAHAPPARLILGAHPPALARVVLVYKPLSGRLARTILSLGFFWGIIPVLIWVPPHIPWVLASFTAGAYLAYRYWTGRYLVCAFTGGCPRCGRPLELELGSTINLPHTLTCFQCHFEPRLEVTFQPKPSGLVVSGRAVDHRDAECIGRWSLHEFGKERAVVCDRCGARHSATPEACRAADAENERADLLLRLTREGRSSGSA